MRYKSASAPTLGGRGAKTLRVTREAHGGQPLVALQLSTATSSIVNPHASLAASMSWARTIQAEEATRRRWWWGRYDRSASDWVGLFRVSRPTTDVLNRKGLDSRYLELATGG